MRRLDGGLGGLETREGCGELVAVVRKKPCLALLHPPCGLGVVLSVDEAGELGARLLRGRRARGVTLENVGQAGRACGTRHHEGRRKREGRFPEVRHHLSPAVAALLRSAGVIM